MIDDIPHIRSTSEAAPAASPRGRAAVVLGWIEHSGKAAQWLLAVLTLAYAVVGVPLVLVVNRYLAAFGQPGLGAARELVGFFFTVFPFVGMLAALGAFPVAIRWGVSRPSYGEHPFGEAYGWLLKDASIDRWRGFCAYLLAHLPSLVVVSLVIILASRVIPDFVLPGVFLALIAVISAADRIQIRPATPGPPAKRYGSNLLVAFLINLAMLCWVALIGLVAIHAAPEAGAALQSAMIGGLVFVHLVMSALPLRLAGVLGLMAAAAVIYFAGTVPITAAAIRQANLGGGTPAVYRASKSGVPAVACEILAIGDTRILWLPDKIGELPPSLETAKRKPVEIPAAGRAPCDWLVFRERARAGAAWAAAGDPAAADAVRVFRRQSLYDTP